jgi:hypothetical protein
MDDFLYRRAAEVGRVIDDGIAKLSTYCQIASVGGKSQAIVSE